MLKVAESDLNDPNLLIEEPLKRIANTWSNSLGSSISALPTALLPVKNNLC